MTVQITKIEIRNFRSARNLTLWPKRLSVLVGKNDSGKSNLLRALNLFFNEWTNPSDKIAFDVDHNVFNQPNRRAKEICIKLEIDLPQTYQETNGDYIFWEKRWRSNGLVYNEYAGYRRVEGPRGAARVEPVEIPARSNVHALLRNINFVYVPAIKDLNYFSRLRASIYDIIAEVADHEFRDSSQDFELSISHQLEDLTTKIAESLGFRSRLALPKDLSHIFESLDFLSEGQSISLDARGDGIKARHVPLILKFMADKKRGLQSRGAPPHSFIWGYEEPENNLELPSCVELADQFWSFLHHGISQIFLTTHSPVFYNLQRNREDGASLISCHHMFRDTEAEGTKETSAPSDLDERMGTMKLFSPLVKELEDRIRQQETARAEARELARANRRTVFVEGPSDKLIFGKALNVFAPEYSPEIDVKTREHAGLNYVVDMLTSWTIMAKHNLNLPRAAGLVDQDKDAKTAADKWNRVPQNVKSAKCFKLPTPPHLHSALHEGFRIPIVLESLYDRAAWEWADEHGHLKNREKRHIIPHDLNDQIIEGNTTLGENLDDEWALFVLKEFRQDGKKPMARHFAGKADNEFRERLHFLEPLIQEIVAYLFPEE